jgi:DNA-binding NtrC family response regulator
LEGEKIMMNVLILEDDIYLAQKVSVRLQDEGYNAIHHTNINEVDKSKEFDTVLLSTNVPVGDTQSIIKKFPNSVIILLVAYVSDATVAKPLKAGANDYVLKPFSMDELFRKVKHFEEFNQLKIRTKCLENYVNFIFASLETNDVKIPTKLPFLIETNEQKIADKIVFETAQQLGKDIAFISLEKDYRTDFSNLEDKLIYIYDYHRVKSSTKEVFLKSLEKQDMIFCSFDSEDNFPYEKIVLKQESTVTPNDTILTINDYVKMVVQNFQSQYPDTELSKKLGISRKSLWEKRKKFGLEKVK